MVKLKESSEFDRLEILLTEICDREDLRLYVNGWARKTFDIFKEDRKSRKAAHLLRIESLAVTNGEIRYYDKSVIQLVNAIGEALEQSFEISEAILIHEKRPEY